MLCPQQREQQVLKTTSLQYANDYIKSCQANYIVGHNFIDLDLAILKTSPIYQQIKTLKIIDTLPLSLLFFNEKTVHSLPKNYKTEDDFKNDPLQDCKITQRLLKKTVNLSSFLFL